jgi:glutamate synthase (NADPH/NADH) large chain
MMPAALQWLPHSTRLRHITLVSQALTALRNMEHRGASGAEPDSGDGAGILIRIPDAYFQAVVDFKLPAADAYATGIAFIAKGADVKARSKR